MSMDYLGSLHSSERAPNLMWLCDELHPWGSSAVVKLSMQMLMVGLQSSVLGSALGCRFLAVPGAVSHICLLLPAGCQSITAPLFPGEDAEPWVRRGGLFGELQVRSCP